MYETLTAPDNSNCGYLIECDLENLYNKIEKTKHLPFFQKKQLK